MVLKKTVYSKSVGISNGAAVNVTDEGEAVHGVFFVQLHHVAVAGDLGHDAENHRGAAYRL